MACNTLKEILKNCDGNAGGVVKFFINNSDAIDYSSIAESEGVLTNIDLDGSGNEFVEFQFNPNTSNFTENTPIDLVTGSTIYEQVITIVLNRREATKRQSLLLIADGQPELVIIIKDSNGLFWGFGFGDDKVYLTGNEGGSGTAKTDHNGYTLTFTSQSSIPAYEIDKDIIAGLL